MKRNIKFISVIGIIIVILLGVMIYSMVKEEGVLEVDKGAKPPKGNENSSITIIEFSDFQCPACKAAEPIIKKVLERYDVAFYYRHFPLPSHKNSFIAAEAAECANEQEQFWEYHDILFENQANLDKENLKEYAKELKLDEDEFNLCLDSEKYKDIVEKDLRDGNNLEVRGTPTFFINGRRILGANEVQMTKIIEKEIEKINEMEEK
jgi:protein-disulfide isomerase